MLSEIVAYRTINGFLGKIDHAGNTSTEALSRRVPVPYSTTSHGLNLDPCESHPRTWLFGSSHHLKEDRFDPCIEAGEKVPDGLWAIDSYGERVRWRGSTAAPSSPGVLQQVPQIDASKGEQWSRTFDPWGLQPDNRDNHQVSTGSSISLDPIATLIEPSVFSPDPHNPFAFGDVAADDTLFQPKPLSAPEHQQQRIPLTSGGEEDSLPGCLSTHVCLESAQEQELRDIAMPDLKLGLNPILDAEISSREPEPNQPAQKEASPCKRKRESRVEDLPLSPSASTPFPFKKAGHNVCEKRYRNKLNVKFGLLHDRIPNIRPSTTKGCRSRPEGAGAKNEAGDGDGEGDSGGEGNDLVGLKNTTKSDKGTILSKAIEYIAHLETRNKRLASEDTVLRTRVDAFEKLATAGALGCRNARVHLAVRC